MHHDYEWHGIKTHYCVLSLLESEIHESNE